MIQDGMELSLLTDAFVIRIHSDLVGEKALLTKSQ